MRFTLTLAALAATALTAIAPATAGSNAEYKITVDSYDLTSARGTERAYASIERQVRRFCEQSGRRTLTQLNEETRCKAELMADVIARIDQQPLTAFHRAGNTQRFSNN